MKNIKRQNGFTIIEMLVVTAIVGLIVMSASSAIFQVYKVSSVDNEISTAVRQAQNVGYWISNDALMAASIFPDPYPDVKVNIGWSSWGTASDYIYEVNYKWLESANGLHKIQRELKVYDENGVPQPGMNRTSFIADNINELNISPDGEYWKITVEARLGSHSVVREYGVRSRVNY